jgi:hypothetical protein
MVLYGNIPSKKNYLQVGPRGGRYRGEVSACIANLTMQARAAWGARPPVESPDIEVRLFIHNPAKDRDGIWTTLLDVLKKARVIHDDSIRRNNGKETQWPVVIVNKRDERAEITIDA